MPTRTNRKPTGFANSGCIQVEGTIYVKGVGKNVEGHKIFSLLSFFKHILSVHFISKCINRGIWVRFPLADVCYRIVTVRNLEYRWFRSTSIYFRMVVVRHRWSLKYTSVKCCLLIVAEVMFF